MTKALGVLETQGSAPEPGRRLCSAPGQLRSAEEQRLAGQFRPPRRRGEFWERHCEVENLTCLLLETTCRVTQCLSSAGARGQQSPQTSRGLAAQSLPEGEA